MRLTVLSPDHASPERLLATFAQAHADFLALGLESEPIDLGVAICTPELARLHDANCVTGARVPRGDNAKRLVEEAVAWFAARGGHLFKVVPSVAANESERVPLQAYLRAQGWHEHRRDVLRLQRAPHLPPSPTSVLSARAALGPYERFCAVVAAATEPQLADVAMRRLDDPRFEVLVALHEGRVVARCGLLSLGETGLIENVVTHPDHRRRGFARATLLRAIDLCARSQFKHVLLGCDAANTAAQSLYAALGFVKIGEHAEWRDPAIAHEGLSGSSPSGGG